MTAREQKWAQERIRSESGPGTPPGTGTGVALLYPNRYFVAMSNLGFLWAHHALNSAGLRCERFTMEEGGLTPSIESGARLADFPVIALSLSYELDYARAVSALLQAGVPALRADRTADDPLVIAAGAAVSANPQPLADVCDAFILGDGEPVVPDLARAFSRSPRSARLDALSSVAGVYVPSAGGSPGRACAPHLDACDTYSHILTPDTEFGDMFLIEVMRGCAGGCRFCMAGHLNRPARSRSLESSLRLVELGLRYRKRVGLVGLSSADYPHAEALCRGVRDRGGAVSFSSVTVASLTDSLIEHLVASGQRTVAMAPEAATLRLRDVVNKPMSDELIVGRALACFRAGLSRVRLYFMLGLPGEADEDASAIVRLASAIAEASAPLVSSRVSRCLLTLSVNPFVPKAGTAFQWAPMAPRSVLRKRLGLVSKGVGRIPRANVIHESVKWSRWQAVLARGGADLGPVLVDVASGADWRAALRRRGIGEAHMLERERPADEVFPWDFIGGGVSRDVLRAEYERGLAGRASVRGPGR